MSWWTQLYYRSPFNSAYFGEGIVQQTGLNSIPVSLTDDVPIYYLGDNLISMYDELLQSDLPPQVLIYGFLNNLFKVDEAKAIEAGAIAIAKLDTSRYPLTNREKALILSLTGRFNYFSGYPDLADRYIKLALFYDSTDGFNLENIGWVCFI